MHIGIRSSKTVFAENFPFRTSVPSTPSYLGGEKGNLKCLFYAAGATKDMFKIAYAWPLLKQVQHVLLQPPISRIT